jgi:hypothetical protein
MIVYDEEKKRTNAISVGAQDTNLLAVYEIEEVLNLLFRWRLTVVLLCDRGIRLRVDLARFKLVGHFKGGRSRELSGLQKGCWRV